MNEVFKTVLSLSCSGGLLAAFLCLMRPLLGIRLSRQWQYYIWLVAVARLFLPLAPEINLMGTIFREIERNTIQSEYALVPGQDTFAALITQKDYAESEAYHVSNEPTYAEREKSYSKKERTWTVIFGYLGLGWLVTALILFSRKITIYQSFVKYIRAGCMEVEDFGMLEGLGKLAEQCNIKTRVELCTNNLIASPLLIGFFRPCIVLPAAKMAEPDFQYTILHELTHFKRRDMFYKWLVQTVICVHWFNPLVYLMGREVERTCELSCDEAIIKSMGGQERRAYGDTLLNAAGAGGGYKEPIASVTLAESKELLKERLDAITGYHRKSRLIRFLSFALAVTICLLAAFMGAYAIYPFNAPILAEKEYTLKELKEMGISGITVNTENDISVIRGGETLKIKYYVGNQEECTLKPMEDYANSQWNLSLTTGARITRPVVITVPEQFDLKLLEIMTINGNISLSDCAAKRIRVTSLFGQIVIHEGYASEQIMVNAYHGSALLNGTALPESGRDSYGTAFITDSGSILFRPADSTDNYGFLIDYGEEAEVSFNGEFCEMIETEIEYEAEDSSAGESDGYYTKPVQSVITRRSKFTINESAAVKIYFFSVKGSLAVQEKIVAK